MRVPMRTVLFALTVALLAWGCDSSTRIASPTSPTLTSFADFNPFPEQPLNGNWTPWFFNDWQPGIGDRLALGQGVTSSVRPDDLCVVRIRLTWDGRTSCRRFALTVSSDGRLDVFLKWDVTATGFDPLLSGDVIIVAPNGRFAASDWTHGEEHVYVLLRAGEYGVLVMNYVPVSLPFQLRTEFRAN